MTLLEDIRRISREAASKLERAECCTDSDICALTSYDLQELLPGLSNFRVRKKISEIIHKKRPIHAVLNELKSFIPDEFLREALGNNGALHEYLQMLKTLKVEINHVQEFLDAHIDLLEKYGQNQGTESNKDRAVVPSVNHAPAASSAEPTSATNTNHIEHMDHFYSHKALSTNHVGHHFCSPNAPASSFSPRYGLCNFETHRWPQLQASVRYKMVVSGNTLDRHLDMMEKLKSDVRGCLNLQETQRDEDSQVIIVFCPVVSRAGTDVETALQGVSGGKPVILVMMHHSRNAHTPPIVKPRCHDVVLVVNVFFHETVPGLLKCSHNDEAIVLIQTKLKSFTTKM